MCTIIFLSFLAKGSLYLLKWHVNLETINYSDDCQLTTFVYYLGDLYVSSFLAVWLPYDGMSGRFWILDAQLI